MFFFFVFLVSNLFPVFSVELCQQDVVLKAVVDRNE